MHRCIASEEWFFATDRRRDAINMQAMLKPAYDGFCDAGVIIDDSYYNLEHSPPTFWLDEKSTRVEVTLESVDTNLWFRNKPLTRKPLPA